MNHRDFSELGLSKLRVLSGSVFQVVLLCKWYGSCCLHRMDISTVCY